jgi:SAM-dependent methyltransferase
MLIPRAVRSYFDNQYDRDEFVISQLESLPAGAKLLDAGAGSQRYRPHCAHLEYFAQDFGKYQTDVTESFTDGAGGPDGYRYGKIDYVGDIWSIDERDGTFDAILCTEVFEHIPYPIESLREFARLLKPGGRLILTVPSNCLRHMDPYYFYSGFSDRFLRATLEGNAFDVASLAAVGDYYRWMAVEIARTMRTHSPLAWLLLAPALIYFLTKRPTHRSMATLCMGYHAVATKRPAGPTVDAFASPSLTGTSR